MRHDWILDVLADLRSYALSNDLPEIAARVDDTLRAAQHELALPDGEPGAGGARGSDGAPP